MSISEDVRFELQRQQRHRENLAKEFQRIEREEASEAEAEEAAEEATDERANGNAQCPPSAPPEPSPVPAKPWLNSRGIQYRPLTRMEREAEEMESFDKAQLKALDNDRKDSELDHEFWLLAEQARKKRERDERRTGTRPLPGSSKAEKERGPVIYNSVQFGVDTSKSAGSPPDARVHNVRRNGTFGDGV